MRFRSFKKVLYILLGVTKGYAGGSWGFIDGRADDAKMYRVNSERLQTVIELLLLGQDFDLLWLSRLPDEWSGFTILITEGVPSLNLSFKAIEEAERAEAFIQYLETGGYDVKTSSQDYNGGFLDRHRIIWLEIALPSNAEAMMKGIQSVAGKLQPEASEDFYVKASRLSEFGEGFKFRPKGDPLAEFFTAGKNATAV